MAHGTGRLIEIQLAGTVKVAEALHVGGGLQFGDVGVAILATERSFDLSVANQTIRHLWQGGASRLIGFFQASMAGLAGIPRIEMPADIAWGLQVVVVIDRISDEGRHVAHA